MTEELIESTRGMRRARDGALVVTALALVVSLAVAATAVSIGIARADRLATPIEFAGGSAMPLR